MKTGACRNDSPPAFAAGTRLAVPAGEVVVWSMTGVAGETCGPSLASMASTTSSSERTMWTRSAPATAASGVSATLAPSPSSARAFAAVRFQTVTASPRPSIASTMPLPNKPVPMNATAAMVVF